MINKILKLLQEELNLNHYEVEIEVKKTGDYYTEIKVEPEYLRAFIKLSENLKEDEYIETITHELCHIITEPLYVMSMDGVTNNSQKYLEIVREQMTEHISRIFLKNNKKRIEKELLK